MGLIRIDPEVSEIIHGYITEELNTPNKVLRAIFGLSLKGGTNMPDLKFARPTPPADSPVPPHATKEELIERAHRFLAGGCHVTFPGIPREEFIALLVSAHDVLANLEQPVTSDHEHICDARFGLERILRSMGAWIE